MGRIRHQAEIDSILVDRRARDGYLGYQIQLLYQWGDRFVNPLNVLNSGDRL